MMGFGESSAHLAPRGRDFQKKFDKTDGCALWWSLFHPRRWFFASAHSRWMNRMFNPRSRLQAYLICAVFVTALSAVLSSSAISKASCGDWLADHESPAAASEGQSITELAETAPSHHSSSLPAPCRGPSCGKRPTLPPAAPPPSLPSTEEERAARLVSSVAPRREALDFSVPADDPRPAVAVHSPLEHPPRATV